MSEPRRRGFARFRHLATPYVALAALAFLASLVFFLGGHGARVAKPRPVDIKPVQQELQGASREVRLELVDASGLARPDFVTLTLPADPAARLQIILGALQKAMDQAGSWPQGLQTPEVYVDQVNRKQVAILDLRESAPVAVGVGEELQLLHSIRQTVLNNGADEVRFLRDGRPAHTLLGHVAVDSAL
jgi:hypothetical protein